MSRAAAACAVVTPVDAALAHLGRSFTFAVPADMPVNVGALVRVPFRGRARPGVVTGLLEEPDVADPKPIQDVIGPGLPPDIVDLASWTARRYLSTFGEALAAALPKRVVSEEEGTFGPPSPVAAADLSWTRDYDGGERLTDGSDAVWRPRADRPRSPAIASLVARAASESKGVLVLVPEVRAKAEVVAAIAAACGDAMAWLGSDASARVRYRAWLRLRHGAAHVAVGGRAAVFAPVRNLGLVVVDDEGHAAYKEGRAPRFHARAVAVERARRAGASVVLVGLPPSQESRRAVGSAGFARVAPPRALERAARPPVTVIERRERLVPTARALSMARETLDRNERVVLLFHRAGAALDAAVERTLRILDPPTHAVLDARTPAATRRTGAARAAVVITTPVIAKDVSIDGVGLLVVAEADAALAQPSFRAPEEVFSTWWRSAPWLGDGRVAVETSDASHPAIVALTRWDPGVLAREEARRRRDLGYPPFATLVRVDVPRPRAPQVAAQIRDRVPSAEVLEPAIDGARATLVVRSRTRDRLLDELRPLVDEWRAADEPMRVDVDPWEVLVPKWRS